MSVGLSFINGFVVLTVDGECYPEEVKETLSPVIKKSHSEVNRALLIDARHATNSATTKEIHDYVSIYKSASFRRIAITVNNPAHYGMARMFATFSESYNKQEVYVFYDIDEAMIWLSK